ncbi:glutathione hydrolase 7-like [Seriola lalandi dorsalis]|uniref:glutathione hydrolase 7-like n=1 Tax=Seriola lalandi dorsalis TaxID=1841481 RepID=UPI000C6FBD29|nr:glutathione hydrolase 7-like [Seriola lalandi dorsalis]
MASGSPNLFGQSLSSLTETDKDSSSLMPLCAVSIIFATGVTVALILRCYLGESMVFVKGALVSDHERCTALGQKVLQDHGSSVDAAIAAALCLGVVHPHGSGIGGGGVILLHDIHKNETKVINFQGTAPKALTEAVLQNVSELEAGLQVGVPGMLRGLHHAHRLYGSLSWEDVVSRAAAVAIEGFSVSFSLAEAISKVKGEQLPQRFREMFFPGGQALLPGSFLRTPTLAGVLQADLSNFYDGNFSQEIVDEVQSNGGVLSREDISNYSVEVEQPLEGLYNEFIIQVPPPPSAGAALISALSLLEGFRLSESNNTENQTDRWIAEIQAEMIDYSHTSPHKHYSTIHSLQPELQAGQVAVMGPDDLMVSVASSLSRPFGSRLITPSGVILNSLMLDFSWPNKTRGQFQTNQRNGVQPGKRPLSSVMPTIVVPAWHKCGIYMALSSTGVSATTQVLISALSNHQEKNESLSLKRFHLPNRPLFDSDSPEEGVPLLHEKGHVAQRVKTDSAVLGILRNRDVIKTIAVPELSDGSS